MRRIGIYQSSKDPNDVVFDVELAELGLAVAQYECRGGLDLELFPAVSGTGCRVKAVGNRWFTAAYRPGQELVANVTAADCLAELQAERWWEDPEKSRSRIEPRSENVNAMTTARALVDLPLLNNAVEQLSDPRYIGVRLKASRVVPVHGSGQSDSFGDDETDKVGQLAAMYVWTHHEDFVRWANEHREQQAARAKSYVKTLNDHPELLDKPVGRGTGTAEEATMITALLMEVARYPQAATRAAARDAAGYRARHTMATSPVARSETR